MDHHNHSFDSDIPILRVHPIENDFIIHWDKKLGTGVNGPVRPCEERETGQKFALKCVLDSPRSRQEVEIHCKVNGHPNIVSLHCVYHNTFRLNGDATPRSRLLLVLELMEGGELFDCISRAECFTEETAAQYMKQAVKAVHCLHERNIAHRDLKPENFLLTDDSEAAVLKLSDFGFAKVDDGSLMTPHFTPYYVAPQVLEAQMHMRAVKDGLAESPYTYDKSCDMWSLGVVLYIMLCGYPPFYSENPNVAFTKHMRHKILSGEFEFPEDDWDSISNEAKDIIRRLLYVDPMERMTIQELAAHPWLNRTTSEHSHTPLHSPLVLADKSKWADIKHAHAVENTQLRLPDTPVMLQPVAIADNPIIRKRRHRQKTQGESSQQAPTKKAAQVEVHSKVSSGGF
ncbi:hypothetical protein C0Q70_08589 [Pomacea canaliculata]|uniref:non-specific serine/threonine protein kinase n=1 Tax=Pomacea canaliculata TaxID=400727 RepID=A0A2T7PIC5_POMCA|nr:hypothetical protein C0Q70_08589 [Pomacea canaliculata]